MKKKIVALLLSCLIVLSGIPAALALENPAQDRPDVFLYDEAQTRAAGDLTLTEGAGQEVPVISSVTDYYKAAGNSRRLRSASSALPVKVDNSQSRFFPEIGDQGSIGSCVSWAQTYYQFTYTMNKSLNRVSTPENCFSPKWIYNLVNRGVDQGTTSDWVYDVLKTQGAATMEQVPYDNDYLSWSPESEIWSDTTNYRLKDYQYLSVGSENDDTPVTNPRDEDLDVIKTALSNGEVLTFSTYMYGWMYGKISRRAEVPANFGYAGENIAIGLSNKDGDHRMTIVGYNDDLWVDINGDNIVQEQEKGAFKVANSWGDYYMMNDGFIWVSYDALNKVSAVLDYDSSERIDEPIFQSISRIDVEPYNSDSNIVLKYTLNSNNRGTTRVYITAEKDGTLYSAWVTPYEETVSVGDNFSYDGTTKENDGFMCCDLDRVVESLDSENFRDYNWTVAFSDYVKDDSVFTVKEAMIVDENTGKTYPPDGSTPFTLNGASRTLKFYQSDRKAAVVYYRGFLNPYICYKTGDGQWTQQPGVPMDRSEEMEGYTHKYAIELGADTETAAVCFTDGNGNWDDNGGAYYTLGNGVHRIITEDADIEPLTITSFTTQLEDNVASTNQRVFFTPSVQGGYKPYQYQYTVVNTETGESEQINKNDSDPQTSFYFRSEGDYKITVKVTDVAGSTAEKSTVVTVKDRPAVFASFTADSQPTAYVGRKMTFSGATLYEQLNMPFGNKFKMSIVKDGKTVAEPAVTITKLDDSIMSTTVRAEWTPTETGNYTAQISVTDKAGATAQASFPFEVEMAALAVKDFMADCAENTAVPGSTVTLRAKAEGGCAPYQYQFGILNPDGTVKISSDYSDNNLYLYKVTEKEPFRVFVNVKDASGAVVTKRMRVDVAVLEITSLTASPEIGTVGEEMVFTARTVNEQFGYGPNIHGLFIKKGDKPVVSSTFDCTPYGQYTVHTAKWTPAEAGNYTVRLNIQDAKGQKAEKTIEVTVLEKMENKLTIYYNGYSNPNIHYQVGDGAWTATPGIAMAATNEVSGYTHKYTIDLGGAQYANVCFNDGYGNWDSQNGFNYRFEAGTYGYSGGKIIPLDLTKPKVTRLTASCGDGSLTVGKTISLDAAAEGGVAPYQYQFGLLNADGTEKWVTLYSDKSSYDFTSYEGGSYKAFVNIKDANGAVGTKTTGLEIKGLEITSLTASPEIGTVGMEMVFTARTVNEQFSYGPNIHGLAIKKGDKPIASGTFDCTQDGQYAVLTSKWTPAEAGNYTVRLYIQDAKGQKAEKTIEVTVLEKPENKLTIYYNGYSNPNIHYQVGDGAWTATPGIAMAAINEVSGYTHKYTIDLGGAQYANVCFNDGNGNWDSQNGFNYRFEAGVYTYQNGVQTRIS